MNRIKTVEIGNCTLICGDCYSVLPKLKVEADTIISDPPYGITACEWDEGLLLPMFWDMVNNHSKMSANIVLFATGCFMIDLINSKYFWYRYDLIWSKNNKVGFLNSGKQPLRSHEHILVFGRPGEKNKATYNPVKTEGRPYVRVQSNKGGVYPERSYVTDSDGTRHPGSVLQYDHDKTQLGNIHPTLKPLELMKYLVQTYSNKKDVVIDPFMGSGTTGVACRQLGRRFIGIEREKGFFDIAIQRIKEA
jgi:site-specific DNA-methyltransferase (adenine-specific)